jgi:hypothetical protein
MTTLSSEKKSEIISKHLIEKIPEDIIREYILPFTYNIKPREHLDDIASYYLDHNIVNDCYSTIYNYNILFYDLIRYVNFSDYPIIKINNSFVNIISRCYKLKNKSLKEKIDFIENFIVHIKSNNYFATRNTRYKSRFLFGLLTPFERNEFINKVIIYDC